MTRVDIQHLLEDLRDAYSSSLEETILTEITANALDSGATRISLLPNAADATLTVLDDGRGMTRRELTRIHRVTASSKSLGDGIRFAGVGIKLGLLVADEVVTETRRGSTHVATTWRLATRYRAPWEWIDPPGLTSERGTAVRLRLTNPLSPLLDVGYLEEVMRTHFATLLDSAFADVLRRHYPNGVVIDVDDQPLSPPMPQVRERATIQIRMGRKRLPSAIAVVQSHDHPLPEDQQGIAISVLGKVIRRGWDWLGLSPASAWRVTGLVEAPELARCLTQDKSDFIRSGPRGAPYLAHRKAIREVVSRQLNAWGDSREREVRPGTQRFERDIERVLEHLADDFPMIRSLLDQRPGGQKPLPLPVNGDERVPVPLNASVAADHSRPERLGLVVQFESRAGDTAPGRLVDRTIWINDAHPAYVRAAASRSSGYHVALTVAVTLAPLAVDRREEPAFITQFLAHWGGANNSKRPQGRRRRRSRPAP